MALTGTDPALNVAGNWTNDNGTFTQTSSTVTLNGTLQSITGDTTFFNLTKTVTTADTLTFAAGSTTTITNALTLQGAAGNLLFLRSSSTPTQWQINPNVTRTLAYLDVKDSNNIDTADIEAGGTNSVNSGNNTKWSFKIAPTATTDTATDMQFTGATLNATVNANGYQTAVTFEYGTDANYGTNMTADQSPVSGNTAASVSKTLTGLTAATTYHYRVKADNSEDTVYGGDQTFTTRPYGVSSVQDGNWNDSATWRGTAPASDQNAIIANSVTVNADAEIQSLTLNSGTTLTIADGKVLKVNGELNASGATITFSGSGTLNLAGTVGCNAFGTFNCGTGTVIYSAGDQTIDNVTYYNLTLSGSGTKTLCEDVTVNGSLTIGSPTTLATDAYNLNIAGNWINSGSFTAGTGTVVFGGSNQSITGDTTFYNLSKTVTTADTLTFAAGSTTTVTGTLTLEGVSGQLLFLRSGSDGTQWKIDPSGTRTITYLDVKDSNNIDETAIDAVGTHSVDSGNNTRWIFNKTPTVTTQAITNIGTATATGNGNITDLGVPNPTGHGVCWSTSANPTIADSKTNKGSASATGAFTADLTGLNEGTIYHVRAYATNTTGTSYGVDVTFTTAVSPTILYYFYYTAGPHGSILGPTWQIVNWGLDGSPVTAVPDKNYRFVNWSDGSTANPRTDTFATSDITVTANFALKQYTLTYTAGAHGAITGTSPQTVTHGGNGSGVTAVPAIGYRFVSWSDGSTANPRTDTNVTANIAVTASFALKQYTLTYTAGTHGSITGTSPQTVNPGASGSAVTAVPESGYRFVRWSDGSTANPRTDTNVTTDITVSANFSATQIVITSTSGTGGTMSPIGNVSVNYGDDQDFTITPDTGYKVSEVLVDGEKVTSISADGGIYPFTAVTKPHTIAAKFAVSVKVLGIWRNKIHNGVYVWEQKTGRWSRVPDTADATMIAAGDVDGDSIDDLIGVWPSCETPGLYVLKSTTGIWNLITQELPTWITAGDMNDDGLADVIGNWNNNNKYYQDGVYYQDSATGKWSMLVGPARQLAAGKIGGARDDLVWVENNDLWVRFSADGSRKQIDSVTPIRWITTGNMIGGNRADIIGSYIGSTWYWDSEIDEWYDITTWAEQVAAGDMDGDGLDDLVGVWSSNIKIMYSKSGTEQQISSTKPVWITTGRVLVPEDASGSVPGPSENVFEPSIAGP